MPMFCAVSSRVCHKKLGIPSSDILPTSSCGKMRALQAAQADSESAGLPAIAVTPSFGKLLMILCRASAPRTFWRLGRSGVTARFG